MIPAWIWAAVVTVVGCILALYAGSTLPEYDPWASLEDIALAIGCVWCAANNNFPLLLAIGAWIPFFPHLGPFYSLPTVTLFTGWMMGVLFFRLCLKGYLPYLKSFNWFLLIIFAWVPIRFLMNPVYHLGGTAGGSGVSGAAPYFNYCLAGALLVIVGAILTDRPKIVYFLRWCLRITVGSGIFLTICAFVPASLPLLLALGSFNAGYIGDGILRLVQLPGYGLFIVQAALCPALFRLKLRHSLFLLAIGFFMILLGGDRSALAAVFIAVPVILLLRRKSHAFFISVAIMVMMVGVVRVGFASMDESQIPGVLRSFGIFDKKIDEATGGVASAEWRYQLWRDSVNKIMETPLIGKGFGNLPKNVETSDAQSSTNFEVTLAGGEAHNGFINSAYGFGIPFTLALTVMIVWFFLKEATKALTTDRHDPELRDTHAFLASMFACYPILLYTVFDLSVSLLWIYASLSCLLSHLPRTSAQALTEAGPALHKYGEESRPAGAYSYPHSYRPR